MDSTKERMISTVATSQQNVANVWIEIKRHSTCSVRFIFYQKDVTWLALNYLFLGCWVAFAKKGSSADRTIAEIM